MSKENAEKSGQTLTEGFLNATLPDGTEFKSGAVQLTDAGIAGILLIAYSGGVPKINLSAPKSADAKYNFKYPADYGQNHAKWDTRLSGTIIFPDSGEMDVTISENGNKVEGKFSLKYRDGSKVTGNLKMENF
jgi:hypothetical protein